MSCYSLPHLMLMLRRAAVLLLFFTVAHASTEPEEILLAAAANFTAPMTALVNNFETQTGHQIHTSFGSSGRFFAQINNGAPFQLFLSADQDKPARLEATGHTVPGSRFTYATGSLVLWSANNNLHIEGPEVLQQDNFNHLAFANPRLAPYGQAALEVLENLNLAEATRPRWVQGENIAQTFQFVSSGNAELGFVALSQVIAHSNNGWRVPTTLHRPIQQDAVLLLPGANCQACKEFLQYLRSPQATQIIQSFGYTTAPATEVSE
ncbi:MAG: molybdate ABC transporter substrate-binding protein [Pseudohongiellaceae bacterium]